MQEHQCGGDEETRRWHPREEVKSRGCGEGGDDQAVDRSRVRVRSLSWSWWALLPLGSSWTKNQSTMSSARSLKIKKTAACSGQVVSVVTPGTHRCKSASLVLACSSRGESRTDRTASCDTGAVGGTRNG